MDEIAGFQAVAPYLTNPLVLVGFVLFLFFGLHRALLKAGIIPPLTPGAGSKIVQSLLRYGFLIALAAIVLGFAFAFYQTSRQHDLAFQKEELEKKRIDAEIEAARAAYCQHPEKFNLDEQTRRDADRACAQAVVALANTGDVPSAKKEDALSQLKRGDAQGAKAIFEDILNRKAAEGAGANKEAAEAALHLGALAFYDSTPEALAAYRRAVELDPDNPDGWNQLGHVLRRIGKMDEAEAAYNKVKSTAESRNDKWWLAVAYNNLGNMYELRGASEEAEAMEKKALELDEALDRKDDMAAAYGDLGIVYMNRGDGVQAETMFKKGLELDEALGRKDGVAADYSNLGIVYMNRGDLAQAEIMFKKGLELEAALGRKDDMASDYGNLGILYQSGGDLERAETMLKNALELNEALGLKAGMASDYHNLGRVYVDRGDLAQAETMHKNALEIDEALSLKGGIADDYTSLGIVYMDRGDLVLAEITEKKALELNEALRRKDDMANDYANLGIVYQKRRDLVRAKAMYKMALTLFMEVGATAKAQKVLASLAALSRPGLPTGDRSQ